jgi:hypothetical protein
VEGAEKPNHPQETVSISECSDHIWVMVEEETPGLVARCSRCGMQMVRKDRCN